MDLRAAKSLNLEFLQQAIKWLVYSLLVINYVLYVREDLQALAYTLPKSDVGFLDWTGAFRTTIDLAAWLLLIAFFEIETYFLSNDAARKTELTLQGLRMVCYIALFHTLYANIMALDDFAKVKSLPHISQLCQLANEGVSYLSNVSYTDVTLENCASLGRGSEWFSIYNGDVVMDAGSFAGDHFLARVDLVECSTWLIIMGLIELNIRLQERGITKGALVSATHKIKTILYLLLLSVCGYWAYVGLWLYAWDEFLWIAGFAAIEMNLSEWRDDIRAEA
jgi:hypothetical protein